jgi:putative ABC transport system permease protein
MLQNHFRVAYRHVIKNKVFSFINVVGLVVSITAFALIVQYISFELSYDRFHSNKDEIYRVALAFYENDELKNTSAKNYDEIRQILKEHFPQIEHTTAFVKIPANTGFLFSYDKKLFNELGGFFEADSLFFKVFPSLLVKGNPSTVLSHPNNLVISESMVKKIFGDVDPIGKHIGNVNEVKGGGDYVVTGILKDIPENAHFHANFVGVVNMAEWGNYQPWNWFFYTYVTIPKSVDRTTIKERLASVNKKLASLRAETKGARIILQPILDIHLKSNLVDELEANGNSMLVYILGGIGFLILMIAWINYINLETARFIIRAKEVGIRRIVGSAKSDLAIQFLVEYGIIVSIALATVSLALYLIFPYFKLATGIPAQVFDHFMPVVWMVALCLLVGGSMLVGIYPSFVLMKLNPVSVLKGKLAGTSRGRNLRKLLVVIQFTASISLIAFLLIINQQLDHLILTNRKIDIDKVIAIRNPTAYMNQESASKLQDFKTLENTLLQHSFIEGVATSSAIPGTEIGFTYVDLIKRNVGDPYDPTRYKTLFIDYNFIPVYGLKMLAGRNYIEENGEDENWETLILNEKAIKTLGFKSPEEAMGQFVQFMAVEKWDKYKIVGVVEDYHHEAAKKEVFPMIFFLNHNFGQQVYYSIKLNAGSNPGSAVDYIEKNWKETFPERPFEFFSWTITMISNSNLKDTSAGSFLCLQVLLFLSAAWVSWE